MHKIVAFLARYGTPTFISIAAFLCVASLISFCFGIGYSTEDKSIGKEIECEGNAYAFILPNSDYMYQCGYSFVSDLLTFVFDIITLVEIGLFWGFVLVWRKKKCVTFIVYCCLLIPLIAQISLFVRHCDDVNTGGKKCKTFKNLMDADCTKLPFIFTPVIDAFVLLFYILGIAFASVLYFCRSRVNKLLTKEDADMEKDLVSGQKKSKKAKKQEEEETDPIDDFKKSSAGFAISNMIDFTKLTGN